ncbi:MAG: HAD family hydrolase [Candidatus Bathyarchaeota archaeon]
MTVKAVVFDLFKTLGEFSRVVTDEEVSMLLQSKGYSIFPQAWRHAFSFTVFIDYSKYGYKSHEALLRRAFQHLEVDVDDSSTHEVAELFRGSPFALYSESLEAVKRVKGLGLKTAIATSTPKAFFIKGLGHVESLIDFICTGYEAGYEKSNPNMYRVILDRLKVEPSEAVVIGDNPVSDIANSKRLGMKAIQIVREGAPSSWADGAAVNVLDAVKLVERWAQSGAPA